MRILVSVDDVVVLQGTMQPEVLGAFAEAQLGRPLGNGSLAVLKILNAPEGVIKRAALLALRSVIEGQLRSLDLLK